MLQNIGIIEDLRSDVYHDHPAVNSSKLKHFRLPTPLHAKTKLETEVEDTDALVRGQVLHAILLEPDRLDSYFVIEKTPLIDKTKAVRNNGSKEHWEAMKAEAEKRRVPVVSNKLWIEAQAMAASIEANPFWTHLGKYGRKELSLFSQLKNIPVKARYDVLYGSLVVDIKSCRHYLTDDKIRKVIAEQAYHLSAAMYLEIGASLGLQVDRFVWVFVENIAPFACRFVEATPQMLDIGRQEFYTALDKYQACVQTGNWPGYDSEDIPRLDLPDWYKSGILIEEGV